MRRVASADRSRDFRTDDESPRSWLPGTAEGNERARLSGRTEHGCGESTGIHAIDPGRPPTQSAGRAIIRTRVNPSDPLGRVPGVTPPGLGTRQGYNMGFGGGGGPGDRGVFDPDALRIGLVTGVVVVDPLPDVAAKVPEDVVV